MRLMPTFEVVTASKVQVNVKKKTVENNAGSKTCLRNSVRRKLLRHMKRRGLEGLQIIM